MTYLIAKCNRFSFRVIMLAGFFGLMSFIIFLRFGISWQTLPAFIFSATLLYLSIVDLEMQLLPDKFTYPLLWLGLFCSMFQVYINSSDAILGAIFGYSSLWVIAYAFYWITGKYGMGHGDFKLLAALGAWVGWQALPKVVLLASLLGTLFGLIGLRLRNHLRDTRISFGPFLSFSGWYFFIFGSIH
jgi:leader peptidase (prepilin peptidase) / N-methyltransferase